MATAFDARSLAAALSVAVCLAGVHAQTVGPSTPNPQIERQDAIYRSQGAAIPSGYVTTRTLSHYEELLPSGFAAAREALSANERWLDIGAGSGQAILDFASKPSGTMLGNALPLPDARGRLVALSIEDRRSASWHEKTATLRSNEIRYAFGKRLRDYDLDDLGRFALITDVYGGFSYTEDLSAFVEKTLALLEPGGRFFTLLQSVRLADGKERKQTWFLTEIMDAEGRDLTPCAWLKRIACVQVACESRSSWDPPTELIEVRKQCSATAVPRLVPVSYDPGTPPGRRFVLVSP